MNRHKQQTRRKNPTEANLKTEMKGSYQMKKMKKACAVLLAVLSVSLLTSAFAQGNSDRPGEHADQLRHRHPDQQPHQHPDRHPDDVDLNVTPVASDRPVDLDVGDLQMVAEFEQQVVGVAVSASGRVFVSFPRNGIDTVKNSVEEVIENKAVAYPNKEINTLNTAEPSTHFLSAQSVYVDSSDTLWVLDVGNLGSGTALISGGAKLVAIDLTTNAVKRTIVFPDSLITKGTSINDVRFDLARGAAGFAYIPDSSAAAGSGIIVVDLSTGNAVRRLANDPTVVRGPAFRASAEGKPLGTRATAGGAPRLVWAAADGIAVSADGKLVYYCPIASRNLYSVDAAVLTDFTQSDAAVAATIKNLGDKGEVGGLEADAQGRVYLTNGEFNAIRRFDPSQGTADTF